MNEQELQDEVQLLTDKLFFAERARDGHYHKLQIALKMFQRLGKENEYLNHIKEMSEDQFNKMTQPHKYFDADDQHEVD